MQMIVKLNQLFMLISYESSLTVFNNDVAKDSVIENDDNAGIGCG